MSQDARYFCCSGVSRSILVPIAASFSLAISPDGRRVYVAERLADSIAVIDTGSLEVVERIDLGGPTDLTAGRRGDALFHNAAIIFQGQFSSRSFHPDGPSHGLTWLF